ncbi:hypothetical protein ACSBR2_034298 [Camellia fascicularis]
MGYNSTTFPSISRIPQMKALLDGYLEHLNDINIGNSLNRIVVVELDTFQDLEFKDKDDNHVGININSLESIISIRTGYFPVGKNGTIKYLNPKRDDPIQVQVKYNGVNKQLNVTLYPIDVPKPDHSLLSLTLDLSLVMLD